MALLLLRVITISLSAGWLPRVSANGHNLTHTTWESITGDKRVVLVKFYKDDCLACEKAKPGWDEVMEEYKDTPGVGMYDVDCSRLANEELCAMQTIKNHRYPGIKFGSPANMAGMKDYVGGLSPDEVRKAAHLILRPPCSPELYAHCAPPQRKHLKELVELEPEELEIEIMELEKVLAEPQLELKGRFEAFWKEYDAHERELRALGTDEVDMDLFAATEAINARKVELEAEKDAFERRVTDSGIRLMTLAKDYVEKHFGLRDEL